MKWQDQDLQYIISACKTSSSNAIVITHGTDKMTHTDAVIAAAQISNKTIVLTGAMIPYAFGSSSDGFINLGCALAYVQSLPPEVYINMQGQYFLWCEVKKKQRTRLLWKNLNHKADKLFPWDFLFLDLSLHSWFKTNAYYGR